MALSLVVLCGFLGLAIDVGQMRSAERRLQESADAAALAGALEITWCNGTANCREMTSAAQNAISENGMSGATLVTNNCGSAPSGGLVLVVNNGPCALSANADPNYGNANYVEAIVANDQPTYFARIFGINSFRVSARAEAKKGNSPFCIYIDDEPSTGGAFNIGTGAKLDANCGTDIGTSITLQQGDHISTSPFYVAGTVYGSSNQVPTTPTQNAPPMSDPLAYLPAPTGGATCPSLANTISTSGNTSISAGSFCSITVNNSDTLTLSPGVYYLQGNFTVANGARVTGTGVTLYFNPPAGTPGTFVSGSGSRITLSAPTDPSNPYYGILIWEAASNNTTFNFTPGSKSSFSGAIYLPGATLDMGDGGSISAYTILVVKSLTLDPGAQITVNADYSSLLGGSPIKGVTAILAE